MKLGILSLKGRSHQVPQRGHRLSPAQELQKLGREQADQRQELVNIDNEMHKNKKINDMSTHKFMIGEESKRHTRSRSSK